MRGLLDSRRAIGGWTGALMSQMNVMTHLQKGRWAGVLKLNEESDQWEG